MLREHSWGTQGIQVLLPGLCKFSCSFSHHMLNFYLAKSDKSNLKSFFARRKLSKGKPLEWLEEIFSFFFLLPFEFKCCITPTENCILYFTFYLLVCVLKFPTLLKIQFRQLYIWSCTERVIIWDERLFFLITSFSLFISLFFSYFLYLSEVNVCSQHVCLCTKHRNFVQNNRSLCYFFRSA